MSGNTVEEDPDPDAAAKLIVRKEFFQSFLKQVTGTGGGEMKGNETASDDGSTTSSQPTPPEYPSPPPPSSSPPESMASLQADSPILDEQDTGGTMSRLELSPEGEPYVEVEDGVLVPESGVSAWMAQNGYHNVPWDGPYPPLPHSVLFVHVNKGQKLNFKKKNDDSIYASIVGPGTVRMVGEAGATNNPLPIHLNPDQQCHQFIDEDVPQVLNSRELMNSIVGNSSDQNSGGAGSSGSSGNLENGVNETNNGSGGNAGPVDDGSNSNVVNHVNGGNVGNDRKYVHVNNNHNGYNNSHNYSHNGNQHYRGSHKSNRGGNRNQGQRSGQNQDGYAPRHNNGSRGGRGKRQYNGYGRDFHGQARDNNNQHMIQGGPEMTNGQAEQQGLVQISPEMMMVPPPLIPNGQMSLLGEPTGPPMAPNAMMQTPPQQFQQQLMTGPPPEMEMQYAAVPQLMSVPPAQNGLLQDPMIAGPSMSVPPPMFAMPPPNGMVMVPSNGVPFNNNKWISYQTMEENDRLHEILTKALRMPSVANMLPTEVEFLWMPIKLGDWSVVVAGIVIQTENLEVSYQGTVLDQQGKPVMIYPMEVNKIDDGIVSNLFRAHSLLPNEDYRFTIRAMINERGVSGDNTPLLPFRTAPGRPEPPAKVHVPGRGTDFIHLTWSKSRNNGAFVSAYLVYVHENEYADGRMFQVTAEELIINNLKAETRYKVTITAINALGESLTACKFEVCTATTRAPPPIQNICLTPVSHRSIRVNWDGNPNCFYWIELHDPIQKTTGMVRENIAGDCTVLGELESDKEYHIRLTATNPFGQAQSDWLSARTQVYRKMEGAPKGRNDYNDNSGQRQLAVQNYERLPPTPYFKRNVDNCPEMEWKTFGTGPREYTAEGATYETPETFTKLYRGQTPSLIVVDDTIHYLRVIVHHKKGQSLPSEKAVIPRDYSQYRPGPVLGVKLSMTSKGGVVAQWTPLDRTTHKLPETAAILYFVQQIGTIESPITAAGKNNNYSFAKIPGETLLNVRVRAAVSFHDALVHGDWSTPVHITTPRNLPLGVININYKAETSLLTWDCLDESPDLQYTVGVFARPSQTPLMKVITKEKNVVLDGVQPGEQYTAVLTSFTNVGRTPNHSTSDFTTPARKPSAPEEGSMIASSTEKCSVAWTAADPNGSPITGYVLKLCLNKKLLRESLLPTHSERNYRVNMKDLRPNTLYSASICGRNAVGDGEPVRFTIQTKPLPPVAPGIECDAEASTLKLRWQNVTSSPSISYKLMRVNDIGQQLTVYEGEKNNFKVKNLSENSEYSFQLKVTDRITAADVTSEIHVFKTLVAPPPPIKQSPTTTLVAGQSYLYLVKWKNVLPSNDVHEQFYRLQVVDATVQGAKWSVAYEGTTSSFELNTESFPGALHVRVLVVRPQQDKELKGSPSPVGYIGNDPPVVETVEEDDKNTRRPLINWYYFGIHPVIVFFSLVLLMIVMVNFSETLFNWVTGTGPDGTPNSTGAPQQAPPTITPTRPPGAQ